jgi:cell division protein FtsN
MGLRCSASRHPTACSADPMAKLTARDYKKSQRRALDLVRLKEFGAGALIGAALTSAVFLYLGEVHRTPADEPRPQPRHAAPADAEPLGAHGSDERYDFYQMLPHFEVVVPEKERDVKHDLPTARLERAGVYVLQAGSYKNLSDAERVAAQLSKQGVDAKVQRVAVDNDVWHRVRVGPITDMNELNRIRKQLQAADVDALVIRIGD